MHSLFVLSTCEAQLPPLYTLEGIKSTRIDTLWSLTALDQYGRP